MLKAVRASLEADSPTSDDVDMEPPEHKKDGSGATDGSGRRMNLQNRGLVNTNGTTASELCLKLVTSMSMVDSA